MPKSRPSDVTSRVSAVSLSTTHTFGKAPVSVINLVAGFGVSGDAHAGQTIQHRSRVAADPNQPNLRQVHLIHEELFANLVAEGFTVTAGQLGENITTRGLYLLALPTGTRLRIGEAVLELTGLRNPCAQLSGFQKGLLGAVLDRDAEGELFRKAGIMGVVLLGGAVRPGDEIELELPPEPHKRLERV